MISIWHIPEVFNYSSFLVVNHCFWGSLFSSTTFSFKKVVWVNELYYLCVPVFGWVLMWMGCGLKKVF